MLPSSHTPMRLLAGLLAAGLLGIAPAPVRAQDGSPAPAPRRVALLIGIADYEHFDLLGPPGASDLVGPTNDVARMRASLKRWGFDGDDVRVLRDGEATRAGILAGLDWVAERARGENDAVVVYYSGHGTWVPDEDGDEALVTPGDTIDEALVPADAPDPSTASALVLDDEIRDKLAAIPSRNVTMIVDACFSGTITRGAEASPNARARGVPGNPGGDGPPGLELATAPTHTLITAASAREVATELTIGPERIVYGILTYYLTEALDGAPATARYDEIMRRVRAGVRGEWVNQTPQLEGDADARLFHVQGDIPQRAYADVISVRDDEIGLDVGAVHGVRPGARYYVYGPDETRFAPGGQVAEVIVSAVADTTAVATVDGVARGEIRSGARAVLARVPRGARQLDALKVYVAPEARPTFDATGVDSLFPVERVPEADAADVALSGGADALHLTMKGLPILPTSEDAAWTARDGDGPGFAPSAQGLCAALRRGFAVQAFELLDNPEPANFDVDIRVLEAGRQPPEGTASGPLADTAYIDPSRRYHIWVRVSASEESGPIYLTAAVEGLVSQPAVLWPGRGQAGRNAPFPTNQWVRLTRGPVPMTEPSGLEVIRVVADADQQYDFWPLVNSFPACAAGAGTRGFGDEDSAATGWVSVAHRVVVLPTP